MLEPASVYFVSFCSASPEVVGGARLFTSATQVSVAFTLADSGRDPCIMRTIGLGGKQSWLTGRRAGRHIGDQRRADQTPVFIHGILVHPKKIRKNLKNR